MLPKFILLQIKKEKILYVPLKYKVINVMLPDEIFVIFFNMEFTYIEYFIECLQTWNKKNHLNFFVLRLQADWIK